MLRWELCSKSILKRWTSTKGTPCKELIWGRTLARAGKMTNIKKFPIILLKIRGRIHREEVHIMKKNRKCKIYSSATVMKKKRSNRKWRCSKWLQREQRRHSHKLIHTRKREESRPPVVGPSYNRWLKDLKNSNIWMAAPAMERRHPWEGESFQRKRTTMIIRMTEETQLNTIKCRQVLERLVAARWQDSNLGKDRLSGVQVHADVWERIDLEVTS